MGDADKAIEKATAPDKPDPLEGMTLRELAESDETYTFSATVDMLLELRDDGTFVYYGSLKMGDDEARYTGRWIDETTRLRLDFDPPGTSQGASVPRLFCRWQPGVVAYPMGRDPKNPVWYRLARLP